ncbi:DUF3575 domain-containing protein [Spirosoma linguale]|uniref:DUF3575 domain-containing protein n=1 Tax=Spirosoma linguale (strain ATCC 33905 / DSM 74 / LMG 10896 / Claus 1) TaxID=504472 RepID=D2QUA3_SPILD|nr:hypothetical protein Slin_6428 [Spirosoma linguale DSM 74]
MKKSLSILIALLTLQTLAVHSQDVKIPPQPQYGPVFIRVYPLELIMHEIRMGVEIPTATRQSIVVDGSYFWGDNSTNNTLLRKGWALKMDYRFYLADAQKSVRFFVGPNLMIKGQQYNQEDFSYTWSSTPVSSTGSRMIYCGNLKMGIDIQLAKEGRSRLELFSGVGLRYQSKSQDLTLDRGTPRYSNGRVLPNILSGILLKF